MLKFVIVPLINVVLTITFCTAQGLPLDRNVAPNFEKQIRPLLQRFCAECHAPGKMGDIDFLALTTEADIANHRDLFACVVEQMQTRVMPPADFDQPSDAERQLVTDWITKKFDLKPKDIDRIATYVVEIHEDRQGHLWFGTVANGVARYDGKSLTWFSEKDGLPSNTVSSIAEDKDGNLWLGTHHGICKFDGKAFTVMWKTSGRHDQGEGWMIVFADRAGNIWTSTNKAVLRFDGTAFSEFKLPIIKEEIKSYAITAGRASLALEDKKGNLWFKTDGSGAFKFDGKSFTDIYTVYETKAGDLWIGATNVGAYRYDGNTFTLFDKTDRKTMTRNFGLQSIHEAQNGTLWFGFSGGLFRFDSQSFFNISKDGPWK